MVQRNVLITAGIIFAAVLIVLVVAYFGQNPLTKGGFDKGQRFTAKPGTTRENAMLLTSANRKSTADPKSDNAGPAAPPEHADDPLEVKSLSEKKSKMRSGPANDVAMAAVNSVTPEAGLRQLETALALPHTQEQAALLYEAQAELYTQLDPPEFEQGAAAYEKALEMTADPELEEEIHHKYVQMLMQAGRDDEALKSASTQLKKTPPLGLSGYKTQLLQGQLQERGGHPDLAEKDYRAVLDAMGAKPEQLDPEEAIALSRLAALRLTQLYRDSGRLKDAEEVGLALKKQIIRMRSSAAS